MAESKTQTGGSWKKYFRTAGTGNAVSPIGSGGNPSQGGDMKYSNYQSQLPEIYIGHPNRLERYNQYEQMDMDSEVNAALDILAEFSTQPHEETNLPFDVHYKEDPTDNEIKIIKEQLQQWVTLNEFNKRMFKIMRNTIKYGDQVFIRDPETFKLFWTEMSKVVKIIVNEADGKKPEQYVIKDLQPNFQNMTATALSTTDTYTSSPQTGGGSGFAQSKSPYTGGSRFSHAQNEAVINAEHVIHVGLTEGLDTFWPFGNSALENVFKVFKQKELLEDSIIIYRVQRAPERRAFYIDVGNMPSHMAMAFVERVKNEIAQRRIPTQTGNGTTNMMDATYNPLSTNEDFFFPQTADGRGSKVEVLQGGQNLGEITDLRFFTNKLFRGLRIPSSYLPTGTDDGSQTYNDGKVGTALIQEWRFNQYCKRLQKMVIEKFDTEFKMFMRWRGINIDGQLFDLVFNDPQNFAQYRQAEVDGARIGTFTQLEAFPYFSKRFLMKRYLGMSEQEMSENENMWLEERGDAENAPTEDLGLRSVGVTPGGLDSDLDAIAPPEGGEEGIGGVPGSAPGGAPGDMGAAPAPAPPAPT